MDQDQDVADNCGVSFDGTCDESEAGKSGSPAPEECKEGDTECLERRRRYMGSEAGSIPPSIGEGPQDATDTLKKLSIGSNGPPDPPFQGLPKDYFKKNYRPDYPRDLQMKKVCAKSQAKKSSGVTKSHPKAVFIPSDPSLATIQKRASMGEDQKAKPKRDELFLGEPSPLAQNRMPPPIISSSDEVIVDWLEEHNIQMLFEYFLGLCVVHQPDDPWTFICELCDKMIVARKDIGAFDTLPRILTAEHIEAIFRIYDRIENGFITMAQYKSALEAMGMSRFSMIPEGYDTNAINKDTFVKEATDAINDMLRSFMVSDENSSSKDTSGSNDGERNRSSPRDDKTRNEMSKISPEK